MDELRDRIETALGKGYSIQRELGGGGMSRVFLARDEQLGRDVVVKVLSPELSASLSSERFTNEIRLAAALQEPHIVPVLTAGMTADGLPFYTMPFIRGESLRSRMEKGPVPVEESVAILCDVARALGYAHRQGVVHRDIKPENVLLSEGTAVVTDFGIAKALQASKNTAPGGTLTVVGTSLGTPAYMAPEQAAADPSTDHRADIYAWGVMAYELLAGHHPFSGKTSPTQLLAAHMAEKPEPIPSRAHVPRPLADLVLRALEKDPDKRPQGADELLDGLSNRALRGAIGGGGLPGWLIGIAALLLVAVAVGGAMLWKTRPASAAEAPLVAVLPFQTEGRDADSSFADGLSDAVSTKLARLAGLRVMDRGGVLAVAKSATSPQAAGKSLGAEYVLRAVVSWANGSDGKPLVRVSPTLIRVADGTTRWAGDPEIVSPADPFTVQANIATKVAEALDVALGASEREKLKRSGTSDTAAYAAYTRGRKLNSENPMRLKPILEQTLREFENAYHRDPKYANAYGMAASVLQYETQLGMYPNTMFDSAAILARKALSIDPGQAQAVGALAVLSITQDKPAEARDLVERAVRDNPNNVELLSLQASLFTQQGDSAGAWNAISRATPLAPKNPVVLQAAYMTSYALRRLQDARDVLAKGRAGVPNWPQWYLYDAYVAIAEGDTAAVGTSIAAYRAHGGQLGMMGAAFDRRGNAAMQRVLAGSTPETYSAQSAADSELYFGQKAQLFMSLHQDAQARALIDTAWMIQQKIVASDPKALPYKKRGYDRETAWLAAARGDRATAMAAMARASTSPVVKLMPRGIEAVSLNCQNAEVYALLNDVDAMLPPLKNCLTMPSGYTPAFLSEPALAKHAADPRLKALVSDLRLNIGKRKG